jgi:hypothetical protein
MLGRRKGRREPLRAFTLGDLREALVRAADAGLGDDAPVFVQTRRGLRNRRFVSEMRLASVDWLDPADDYRVLLLVTQPDWRLRP